jgi:hypothetical protein
MLLHIHALTRAPPLPIVRQAILDAAPAVRTLMHKHGGKVIGKPVALSEKQRTRYAIQAILAEIASHQGTLEEKLAKEMIAVLRGTSNVVRKKLEQIHQVAMVNRYVVVKFCVKVLLNVVTEGMCSPAHDCFYLNAPDHENKFQLRGLDTCANEFLREST